MNREKRLTLYELNNLVREVLECEMPDEYWVEAELSECREARGHCYMELIQKDERNATPIAKASARCWASKWMLVRPYFERTTGQRLHAGMKVLLKVYAQFHEAYGFSWIVTDIDPTYTLGDMARKRQEIIRQLKEEGVFDLQKELQLPLFCQRIAFERSTAACAGEFRIVNVFFWSSYVNAMNSTRDKIRRYSYICERIISHSVIYSRINNTVKRWIV